MEKWESSGWAKKLAARQVRKVRRSVLHSRERNSFQNSNDFERFQVQLAKRSRRDVVRKAYVKEKKASA